MVRTATVKQIEKPHLTVKAQTLATLAAVVTAVAIPQLLHVIGAVSGIGTVLGEVFLPMHFPILLVGLLAGPYAGAVSGLLGPAVSFALSGMPGHVMLPFMMIELCVYGLSAGILRDVKIPVVAKVLVSQVSGRAVRAVAMLISIYALGLHSVRVEVIWMSAVTGIFGLLLQWIFLPFVVNHIQNKCK